MENKNHTYRVTVNTTNASKNTTCKKTDDEHNIYYRCFNGVLYVTTEDPKKIYDMLGEAVISIENIGIGYVLL